MLIKRTIKLSACYVTIFIRDVHSAVNRRTFYLKVSYNASDNCILSLSLFIVSYSSNNYEQDTERKLTSLYYPYSLLIRCNWLWAKVIYRSDDKSCLTRLERGRIVTSNKLRLLFYETTLREQWTSIFYVLSRIHARKYTIVSIFRNQSFYFPRVKRR